MRKDKGIKLNFRIDDDYLIVHTLLNMSKDRFSSVKYKSDIVDFQNYAWKKSKTCYNLLVGRLSVKEVVNSELHKISKQLPSFLRELKTSKQYKKLRRQTEECLKFCKNQWSKNYAVASKTVSDLTGLKLNKKFDIYITHPSLKNGSYRGSAMIEWGHHEDWPNYATVYLWHEVLHSYLGRSDKEHAVIELITDEELRVRLNGGEYPSFVGHKHLGKIKQKLLPRWRKYLRSEKRNIREFIRKSA